MTSGFKKIYGGGGREREEEGCRHDDCKYGIHITKMAGYAINYVGYSFRLAEGFFYMHHPTYRIAHTTAFVTPVMEHWMQREIAQ